jgi:hypothetical protein
MNESIFSTSCLRHGQQKDFARVTRDLNRMMHHLFLYVSEAFPAESGGMRTIASNHETSTGAIQPGPGTYGKTCSPYS